MKQWMREGMETEAVKFGDLLYISHRGTSSRGHQGNLSNPLYRFAHLLPLLLLSSPAPRSIAFGLRCVWRWRSSCQGKSIPWSVEDKQSLQRECTPTSGTMSSSLLCCVNNAVRSFC